MHSNLRAVFGQLTPEARHGYLTMVQAWLLEMFRNGGICVALVRAALSLYQCSLDVAYGCLIEQLRYALAGGRSNWLGMEQDQN